MNYPSGMELIETGRCPMGCRILMSCKVCEFGHMLECHFPMDCREANCRHYQTEHGFLSIGGPDPEDFGLDPDWSIEDLNGPVACEFCGCTEFNACPDGCAWLKRYLERGRAVCTQCRERAISFDVNWGAFNILLRSEKTL